MTDYESWRQFAAGWGLFYFVAMFTVAMIYALSALAQERLRRGRAHSFEG